MLGMAPGKMAQAASEIPEGRTFSGIDYSGVTVASSWTDEGKYDANFYSKIESEYENGYTTADTALEIGTAAQLAAFAKFVNDGVSSGSPDYKNSHGFENKFVCLTDDIDLQGVAPTVDYQNDGDDSFKVVLTGEVSNNWVIGASTSPLRFHGTFDGKNHSILGMVEKSESYGGLFGLVSGAIIQNVGVKNGVVIAGHTTGSIVGGAPNSTIQNCYATGEIYARYDYGGFTLDAGGIIGYANGATVKSCYNSCNIFANGLNSTIFVGGIVGEGDIYNTIESCYSSASNLYASGSRCLVGGILGVRRATINNSYYDKDVAGDIGAVARQDDTETVKGLTTAEFKQKLSYLTDETGSPIWFLDIFGLKLKTPHSSDFTFTLPDDLDYDGQGKTITIAPKAGITGMGTVTVKYYKVENGSTTLLDGPPTDAGRYKVKFDVASGTEYYSAKDLPAMF